MARGKILHPEEARDLLELLRKHQRLNKKGGEDGSPLPPPKKPGLSRRPENTPEALAGKLMWLTPDQQGKLGYTLEAVHMSRSTYKLLLPKAMELLRQIPQTRFYKADSAQQTRMLDHIRAASPGDSICVAQYAFTLKSFSDALIERKRAGVEVRVLVDLTWLKAHREALEVLSDLRAAGIEVKHLGGHEHELDTARGWRRVRVTEVQGYNEGVASARELFDEHYNCDEARVAQEDDLESLAAA
ncbi:hypothetical protein PHYBOEH_010015 [Phytophthora boehmeriae]|uniref:Phospholipase D-like domain-containing protein n=1 Tax=Phytophthora boehmeriae TaxID=109152 RepID=A0A8T1VSQ6_9STRA|nr:hypothetical protein PHYBOEH_010015 [Phytophthora boehmeriae]